MKAIILAGGLAKRLYPITEFVPKPLLPVAGKPIIQYTIEKLESIEKINRIYISTNDRFEKHFKNFLNCNKFKKNIKLVIDEKSEKEEKIGAVAAINFLIKKEKINEDIIIVLGDNLFDFSLIDFKEYFHKKNSPIVAFYDIEDFGKAKNFGIAELDEQNRLVNFEEKSENPKTTLVSTGCYLFPKEILSLLSAYITDKNNPDAPGFFIKWLSERKIIHGFNFKGKWFDIGQIENYKQANIEYEKR